MNPAVTLPRRTVLAVGILGGTTLVTALAGCTSAAPVPAAPVTTPPDVARATAAVERARTASRALAAQAAALARTQPRLAALLAAVEADHAQHLSALGETVRTPTPSPDATAAARPVSPSVAVAAELAAAQTALDDAQTAGGGLAVLLTRIAAARAVHADLLASQTGQSAPHQLVATQPAASGASVTPSPTGTPTGTPTATPSPSPSAAVTPTPVAVAAMPAAARDALGALAAGEHAAVYAYGVITARIAPGERGRAQAAWASHVRHRDELEERLQDAGVEAPVAAPAYDLGAQAQDPAGLAAAVEDGLATLAARAVAATTDADRRDAADSLVAAARGAAGWRGRPVALPG